MRDRERKLCELIRRQHGFFTARQAIELGYSDSIHTYHVKCGNWLRVARALYRLRNWPEPEWPYLDIALWWTADRRGTIKGVLSHETALALWEGIRPDPERIHLTVPPGFRRNSRPPAGVVLHKERLPQSAVTQLQGYPLVTREFAKSRHQPEAAGQVVRKHPEESAPDWDTIWIAGRHRGTDYSAVIEAGMD